MSRILDPHVLPSFVSQEKSNPDRKVTGLSIIYCLNS